jgi:branched-chain amino acid transport system substrate-binding protein
MQFKAPLARGRRVRPPARALAVAAALVALVAAGCSSGSDSSSTSTRSSGGFAKASGPVRGFDGTTITLGGIGLATQLPGAGPGVLARLHRFNAENEVPGVRLKYVGYKDDNSDPSNALSVARDLVTASQVFAIVGDTSAVNPVDYFKQQHVPYFGWAIDSTYCTPATDPGIWGFGYSGCINPTHATQYIDVYRGLLDYARQATRSQAPTIAVFSDDGQAGKDTVKNSASSMQGTGFQVVYHKANVPTTPVSDYTPYVQGLLTSDHGHAPSVVFCIAIRSCVPIYQQLRAAHFAGVFAHPLYSDDVLVPMKGSVAFIGGYQAFNEPTAGVKQLKADLAGSGGAKVKLDTGVLAGYVSTDMFISALETVAAKGKDYITPENVRAAAAHHTWQMKGLAGPTKYPDSTVLETPACSMAVLDTGAAWKTVAPYRCSAKRFPVLSQMAG